MLVTRGLGPRQEGRRHTTPGHGSYFASIAFPIPVLPRRRTLGSTRSPDDFCLELLSSRKRAFPLPVKEDDAVRCKFANEDSSTDVPLKGTKAQGPTGFLAL